MGLDVFRRVFLWVYNIDADLNMHHFKSIRFFMSSNHIDGSGAAMAKLRDD